MSVVEALKGSLADDRRPTLGQIGGVEAILSEREAIAISTVFDAFVGSLVEASPEDQVALLDVLMDGVSMQPRPVVFRDAVGALLDAPVLLQEAKPRLADALQTRVTHRSSPQDALLAAYALEAMFRLGLKDHAARWRTLIALDNVRCDDADPFVIHAAKIAGAAFHRWREPALREILIRLQANAEAEDEATFELGMIAFSEALDLDGSDGVRERMREARALFAGVLRRDAGRLDASIHATLIDIVIAFVDGASDGLAGKVESLGRLLAERHDRLGIGRLPDWLAPRAERDFEWWRLIRLLSTVDMDLGRPSWLDAGRVLERVLTVYGAERTILAAAGLDAILAPRIEAAFVRERGLMAHLDDVLRQEDWSPEHRRNAERLRERITERIAEGSPSRLAGEEGAYPRLGAILRSDDLSRIPEEMAHRLEASLADKEAAERAPYSTDVQRICEAVGAELAEAADYQRDVKRAFDDLVQQVAAFCVSRQNETLAQTGERGAYLRRADALEGDLQRDLKDFLAGNMSGAEILTEVSGVAAGRTDVYVNTGGIRFVVELKRHSGLVDDAVARAYRAQAVAYQTSGPKLGMLGILELTKRSGPPPSVVECVWTDAYIPDGSHLLRHLVVFRVPGMLKTPSAMT